MVGRRLMEIQGCKNRLSDFKFCKVVPIARMIVMYCCCFSDWFCMSLVYIFTHSLVNDTSR